MTREWSEVFHGKRTVILMSSGGELETNSYALIRDLTLRALIDPFHPELLRELRSRKRVGIPPEIWVIFTHLHPDHVSALNPPELDDAIAKCRYLAHPEELKLITTYEDMARQIGMEVRYPPSIEPVALMEQELRGELGLEVLHTPGHSPGSITLVLREGPVEVAIVGDLIFQGAVGRWDLPGGDIHALSNSLRGLLRSLRENALLLPGHGPVTRVGEEMRQNSFLLELIGTGGLGDENQSDWV